MNSTKLGKLGRHTLAAAFSLLLMHFSTGSALAGSITLEGQNKGDTNTWSAGNLQNWLELDYIPCRVHFDAGSAGSQTITVTFEHRNGGVPGIEDLTSFTTSANAVFTSAPVLSAPVAASTWSYTFTVNITNNQAADVLFFSRLAAGAHLNVGSSMGLSGNPSSMGSLQIHKPNAGPGAPDLAVLKKGPATVPQGGTITYTLSYTNKAATNTAVGSQITDILPAQVSVITNTLPGNAHLAGNTLTFDLTNVAAHASGSVTFQVSVPLATAVGTVISNYSQILSSENDLNYADNTSSWVTTVTLGCSSPSVASNPAGATKCPGDSVTFSVTANGTSPLTYRWRKGGNTIPGATNSTYSIASVSAADAGSYDVVVTNLCGTATSAAATLTVNDPVGAFGPDSQTNCSGDIVVFSTAASGTGPYSYQWFKDGGLLAAETTSSLTLSNVALTDTATYNVIVSGACGSVTNSASLTVTAPPIITCTGDKNVELGDAWTFDDPTANYLIILLSTVTNTAGHCGTTFDATRTWQAADACGNASVCSQKVTVADTTAPVINCSNTNKTVELGSAWSFDAPTATDNSGSNTISILSTVTNTAGHCGTTFDATRTWQAADACGNASVCSQKVTVADTTAPVINCSNTNKTVELGSAWSFDAPTATDNSGSNTISILSTVTNTAGHCGTTFDATRTWQAADACGNASVCSQKVTVADTTAPVINCSNTNKTVELGAAWTFDAPTATDNSGSNTISILSTVTNTAGHCGTTFDATRTWQAADACGNASVCSQKVTVTDTTAPVITCANTNKTVELGAAWSFDAPSATDNSGSNTISILSTVTNTAGHCGTTFDATRTWQAADACGNASVCSQKVTVADTTAPVINCATNKIVQQGSAWSFNPPTFSDNGGTNGIIIVIVTTTNTTGHCGTTFDATRTWTATDPCGNSASCSQNVNIVDTTAPVINCSNTNKTVELGSAWSFDAPTATDNSGSNTITILSTVTNTAGHCGNTFDATRTWQAADACGNASVCSQKVTVADTTAPVINCSNTNKTVELGSAWSFDAPTATDNSGSNTISILSTVTNTAGHCGTTFDATRTWQAADACGNASVCSQKVTVADTTAPVINCSNTNKTVELGSAWSFDAPTATDNSGSNTISILSTVTNTAGHCGTTFDATRTWQAADACGNASVCSQKVTVADTTAPVINCSNTNKTVELGSAWSFDAPTATDNSGSNTISILSTVTNTAGHCGTTFDATRTWQAADACGNASVCSQKVTVADTTAPVINCSNTNKTVELGAAWTFDAPTATDNSGSNTISILSTVTNTAGHCGTTFDATRTWQAADACGNASVCSQKVTVTDTTAPVITCANTNKTVELGAAWSFDAPSATDNSGSNTISILSTVTNTAGHCGTTFDATRTWQAADACGNASVCSQKVTVADTTAPVINCATNKIVQQGSAWSFNPPTFSDNGGTNGIIIVIVTTTNTTGHCGTTFDATRTWTATDPCGNSASCSQNVNIVDTTAPVINCSNTNKTVELGSAWSFDAPTATDNSGSNTITILSTVTNTAGHCGNTFDATRTWQAADACGNASVCSQKVTVADTTAPTVSSLSDQTACPGTMTTFTVSTTEAGLSYQWYNGANALAGQTASSLTLNNVLAGNAGTYSVRVSDGCGNATTNGATLTVRTNVSVSALAGQIVNPGANVTFNAAASGSGTLTYVWKKNGVVIAGQTASSLTLNSVTIDDAGTYSVEVTGACHTATRSAALVVNLPPVVSIIEPTNNSVFIIGQQILIKADAFDQEQDGMPLAAVTNVEFFANTTKLGEVPGLFLGNNVLSLLWTNATAGDYQLWARATDNMGLSATSSVAVSVRVLDGPDMTIVNGIHFNPQTSLYEETVRICNPTPYDLASVGVEIQNLRTNEKVFNSSYVTNNGNPVVVYNQTLAAGSCVDMLIRYYVKTPPVVLNVTLVPFATMPTVSGASVGGVPTRITRCLFLPNSMFLVNFETVTGATYYVQYSSDLINWKTSTESVNGTGNSVQWLDYGPPATDSVPKSRLCRFYRVIRAQ